MGKIVQLLSAPNLEFDCGDSQLNRWFRTKAIKNEVAGFSRTHVMHQAGEIIGFYTLSAAAIDIEATALGEASAPDPIPAILLGRMAVASKFQRVGAGKRLLADAIDKTNLVAQDVGVALILVHPKPNAIDYYRQRGFVRLANQDAMYLRIGN
jgi:predicted N-acetyltransferase YhbS